MGLPFGSSSSDTNILMGRFVDVVWYDLDAKPLFPFLFFPFLSGGKGKSGLSKCIVKIGLLPFSNKIRLNSLY